MNLEANSAALAIALGAPRSPLPFERCTDEELLPRVREKAQNASPAECLDALARARRLCDDVYEVCEAFRDGKLGEGVSARQAALGEIAGRNPGFTEADYEAAFAAGLLWTAF